MTSSFELGGVQVAAGRREVISVPVLTGLNGATLKLTLHVLHGAARGPVLAILCALHGGEWFPIPALRRLVSDLEPEQMAGTLIVVPVANPNALAQNSRNLPDRSDGADLNRIFPGPLTWAGDQVVRQLAKEVVDRADGLLDLHMGPWGSAFHDILIGDDFAAEVVAESERLAVAFGSRIVRQANVLSGFPGSRSSLGYAGGVRGIPALGVEIGGAGFGPPHEDLWLEQIHDGIRRVMAAMGILSQHDGEEVREDLLIYRNSRRVNPREGGLLRPVVAPSRLASGVREGELLGTIVSPYSGECLEELTSPVDGRLFYVAREYPVRPGDWAFGVAATDAESRMLEFAGAVAVAP